MDVSDRRMQVQLTQEAKIASDFFFIGAIFAFVGSVSAMADGEYVPLRPFSVLTLRIQSAQRSRPCAPSA